MGARPGPAINRRRNARNGDRANETALAITMPVQSSTGGPGMSATDVSAPAATRLTTWMIWAGRVVTIAPVLVLLWSARAKLTHSPFYVREWSRIGWNPNALNGVGLVQVTCLVLYLIPQTSVLGTVLLTGYLGGAIASYVRMGEFYPPLVPLTTCLLAWLGVFLRDDRLRVLLPLRRRT